MLSPQKSTLPIPVGLAVQLHNMFGSRLLCDLLNRLGYCVSYTELLQFESSAAFHQNIKLPPIPKDSILHFSADNVDHNIRTLDGHNTFHGMGIIAIITRGCFAPINVPRRTVSNAEILSLGTIEFKILKIKQKNLSFKFEKLKDHLTVDNTRLLGTLWQCAWILKPNQPQWNGFMQSALDGEYPGKSTVHIMPMIDEKSSDYSCIYTTMIFIAEQAKKYNKTPLLTFDQPLYWKATEIQMQEQNSIISDIVLILGSFHNLMSFLGSIGTLMNGTGLQSLLEQVYAENAVPHILSGKAVARARRAHLLAVCALEGLKMSEMYDVDLSSLDPSEISEQFLINEELRELPNVLEKCISREEGVSDLIENETFRKLLIRHQNFIEKHKDSKTSLVWIMYMDLIDIMCTFIKAERTGDFLLHLQCIIRMFPYLAASGHFLYLKSAHCYVQQMQELQVKNPMIYKCFLDGYHIVRRSDKFFAGIGTDLMIEQELMRSVKTTGGLTHGRGMTEIQRTKWLLSTTTTAAVKQAMEEFSGVRYESSEQHVDQHKESSKARISRDYKDALKMLKYLEHRNPFEGHPNIVSIETGEEGDEKVNVHLSKEVGQEMVDAMVGQPILNISFSRKGMVTTMKPRASVDVEGEVIPVDPQLLFQRLLILVQNDETLLTKALEHELSTHPAALVGNNGFMHEADKPSLGAEIWNVAEKNVTLPINATYVLDGGHLLFKMRWKKGSSFEEIFKSYENYVLKHYGNNVIIVFDGYPDEPDTKDTTHLRRKLSKTGRFVNITPHMKLNMKKEKFLSVLKNKQLFNNMLMNHINSSSSGIQALHDVADADYLIAQTAINVSKDNHVVVISADTDVLILLIHGVDSTREKIFLTSDSSTSSSSKIWDIDQISKSLGSEVCQNILSVHAFLGCDTVSRIFGFGKGKGLKTFLKDADFRQHISLFSNENCTQDEISNAGELLMIMLYGGKGVASLNELRHSTFHKKISNNTKAILPEHLPPTSDAASFHSLRAYHQVQAWKGIKLPVDDWGFIRRGKYLLPKLMSKPPAPANLMKLIKCNCQTGCGPKSRCSCRQEKIKCTPMCGNCKGVSCTNHQECEEGED